MIDTSQDGGVTRAQALGMGAAALGAAVAGGFAASAPRVAQADGVNDLDDSVEDEGDYNPYSGVAEDIEYISSADGHVSAYAVPQVTYADERAANPKRVLVVVD